jgi:hypothetical protein
MATHMTQIVIFNTNHRKDPFKTLCYTKNNGDNNSSKSVIWSSPTHFKNDPLIGINMILDVIWVLIPRSKARVFDSGEVRNKDSWKQNFAEQVSRHGSKANQSPDDLTKSQTYNLRPDLSSKE